MDIKKIASDFILRYKIARYSCLYSHIKENVFKKDKIKVVFFVLYDSMWKSDGLFKLLMQSEYFDPYIISTPYPSHPLKFRQENQEKLEQFFTSKGFPYINGYDFTNNKWFDIKTFKPDIVFYQQPYNAGYKGFKIESLWNSCLFGYIPYCYDLEKNGVFYNCLLQNISWRLFLPTNVEKEMESKILFNKGKNIVVSGYSMADVLLSQKKEGKDIWKIADPSYKRVIWAPHHSILESDALNYSNFLQIADNMLDLANKYSDKLQFAFKPHPVLKRKLYKHPEWGVERTDAYYKKWMDNKNTALVEGDYVDLFLSSDAMVHDSASFTAEYLYTFNPVLFISKVDHSDYLSDFGKLCYDLHYKGSSINEIENFIDDVVLKGVDPLLTQRSKFVNDMLIAKNGKTVAENIFIEFETERMKYGNKR